VTSAWEIVDAAMTESAIARLPMPVLSGEKPSTSCWYSESRKKCPEEDRPEQQADHVCGGQRSPPEDPQVDERRARALLDDDGSCHQHGEAGERGNRLGGGPTNGGCPRERVDQEDQPPGHGHRTGDVEVPRQLGRTAFAHDPRNDQQHAEADWNVDEEDPLPARELCQHSAEQKADRGSGTGDRSEDSERLVALRSLLERDRHDREDRRRQNRAGGALKRARRDQRGR